MKILIFGGAFDPIHQGHLLLLREAQREIKPCLTLVIPTSDQPVHKKRTLLPAKTRLLMLKETLSPLKNTKISTWETRRTQPTYTWQTLKMIEKKWPRAKIYLLLGSDNIKILSSWHRIKEIISRPKVTLVIGKRQGFSLSRWPHFLHAAKVHLLKGAFPGIASQKIRKDLASIIMNHLRLTLPPSRFQHTLACDKLAVRLARAHGVSPTKAHLAALLHDASRRKETFSDTCEALRHGPQSAKIAQETFGIRDPDILEAIRFHTTGRPKMSSLAQILYVADFCAYDRNFREAQEIRRLAIKDLRRALMEVTAAKIVHLKKTGQFIHLKTLELRQWLKG